jgi:hypothetical protein
MVCAMRKAAYTARETAPTAAPRWAVALDGGQGQLAQRFVDQVGGAASAWASGSKVGWLPPATRRSARTRSAGRPRRAARRPGRSGTAWPGGGRGPAGPGRRRPSPAGRRLVVVHIHVQRREARPLGQEGAHDAVRQRGSRPAGRRWRARWWRGSARLLRGKGTAPRLRWAAGRPRLGLARRARPSGDSRRSTSASARSSCTASTPRERRKPVR